MKRKSLRKRDYLFTGQKWQKDSTICVAIKLQVIFILASYHNNSVITMTEPFDIATFQATIVSFQTGMAASYDFVYKRTTHSYMCIASYPWDKSYKCKSQII